MVVYRFGGDGPWTAVLFVAMWAFLSFFSMASGALSIAAAAGLLFVRRICGVERNGSSLLLAIVLLVAFVVAVAFTPELPLHAGLKAKNLPDFMVALLRATGGGILYIPLIVFMIRVLREPPPVHDRSWFVFSLGLWVFGQIFAISYGRAQGILSSRYLDLFAIGILLNAYCLMVLFQQQWCMRFTKPGIIIWIFLVMTGLGLFVPGIMRDIAEKKAVTQRNQDNVYGYLATGDSAWIQKQPYRDIPYPDVIRLKSLLDSPIIAGILTPSVNGHNSNSGIGFYTDKSRKNISVVGSMLFFYGIGIFLFNFFRKIIL